MKKNQIYGLVSTGLGVLLFLPLVTKVVSHQRALVMTSQWEEFCSFTFLDSISEIIGSSLLRALMGILVCAVIGSAITLLVIGILFFILPKSEKLPKLFRIVSIVAGCIAICTALYAIPARITAKKWSGMLIAIYTTRAMPILLGIILLISFGTIAIIAGLYTKKVTSKKRKGK